MRARRVGQAHYGLQVFPSLPAKKFASLFFKKSLGLGLYSRTKVSGTAHPLYAAVAAARENSDHFDSVSVLVRLYKVLSKTNSPGTDVSKVNAVPGSTMPAHGA